MGLTGLSDDQICRKYGTYSAWFIAKSLAQGYKREIERRGLIAPADWTLVTEKRIRKGMTQCAMYASWGIPLLERPSDRYEGEIQHVYGTAGRNHPGAVYTRNGIVVGWSY